MGRFQISFNPGPATLFCHKKVVCFLCLLHIFKCTSDLKGEQSDLGPYCLQVVILKIKDFFLRTLRCVFVIHPANQNTYP